MQYRKDSPSLSRWKKLTPPHEIRSPSVNSPSHSIQLSQDWWEEVSDNVDCGCMSKIRNISLALIFRYLIVLPEVFFTASVSVLTPGAFNSRPHLRIFSSA